MYCAAVEAAVLQLRGSEVGMGGQGAAVGGPGSACCSPCAWDPARLCQARVLLSGAELRDHLRLLPCCAVIVAASLVVVVMLLQWCCYI